MRCSSCVNRQYSPAFRTALFQLCAVFAISISVSRVVIPKDESQQYQLTNLNQPLIGVILEPEYPAASEPKKPPPLSIGPGVKLQISTQMGAIRELKLPLPTAPENESTAHLEKYQL